MNNYTNICYNNITIEINRLQETKIYISSKLYKKTIMYKGGNMKYLNMDEMTIGTKRTLKSLRESLTQWLMVKPLEQISIQELCDKAMISRGTFYNYFYDKYDLLNYDWTQLQLEIDPEYTHPEIKHGDYQGYMNLFLQNLIKFLSKERDVYKKIINNNANSIFSANMHEYIESQILLKLKEALSNKIKSKIPLELMADVYANTIITMGRWWLKFGDGYTEEEAFKFFIMIIDNNIVSSKNS